MEQVTNVSTTVNTRQFAILIFIVGVSTKIFMLPALIMGVSGRDSWITLIAYFLIETLVLLLILLTIRKNPNRSMYEILESRLGKILARIILSIVLVYYLLKMTVMVSEVKVFFVITATESLNWQLCIVPFLVALGLMSLKTLRGIGRVSEIMLPLILIAYVILGLIMAKSTDFTNLLPVLENGLTSNVKSFLLLPIWLTDFSVLTIFMGRIEKRKKMLGASFLACVFAFIVVLYFNIVMLATYSYAPKLLDYGHNVTNMLLHPTGTYNYGRFDLVIFSIWMLGIMIHLALLFYVASRHLKKITSIKNNYITGIIIVAMLFILSEHIFPDELNLYSYSVSVFNYLAFIVEILFPLFLFICGMGKRDKFKNRCQLLKNTN